MMKLNGKKLTNAVVLSLMLAAPFSASAEEITVTDKQVLKGPQTANSTITGTEGTVNITFEGDPTQNFSVHAENGTSKVENVNNINITGTWGGDNSVFHAGESGNVTISADGDITASNFGVNSGDRGAKIFHAHGGDIEVEAKNIYIDINTKGNAVFSQEGGSAKVVAEGDIF